MTESEKILLSLKEKAKLLQDKPGVYRFFDKNEKIIYVGKAKNLRKRVLSYFTKTFDNNKTRVLVRNIRGVKHFVVETEIDALLLENNLIKKYRPRYNVLLKDDKSYPFICIKNENFPRVFQTRNVIKDGSDYYGPYTSVRLVRTLLDLFSKLFQLRTCKQNLSDKNIAKNKFKVCLEYHINNCKAPCVALQTKKDYDIQIIQIRNILKGNFKSVKVYLKERMLDFSEKLEFENAQIVKEKLDILSKYQQKSTIINPTIGNVDVFSVLSDSKFAYVNFLKVVNGAIIQVHTVEIQKKIDETDKEILQLAMIEILHSKLSGLSNAREIIVPFEVEYPIENVKIVVPKIGDKKKLLELSQKNVKYFRLDKIKQKSLIDPERHKKRILETMKKDLRLSELPKHIECFDNSNIQGTNPVASCVVFRDAKPYKKDYRKFNIKTVVGADDFASMEEIIYRRYKRLTDENQKLPQLIIIDGGKGQLSSALKSLEKLNLRGEIAIIGIAKKLEEIYFPGDSVPLYLDKNSETLKVIQQARNEAHRFGITFHRNKRSKDFIKSELDSIKGIGKKTAEKLLNDFKSVKGISEQKFGNLEKSVGKPKALIIFEYFAKNASISKK